MLRTVINSRQLQSTHSRGDINFFYSICYFPEKYKQIRPNSWKWKSVSENTCVYSRFFPTTRNKSPEPFSQTGPGIKITDSLLYISWAPGKGLWCSGSNWLFGVACLPATQDKDPAEWGGVERNHIGLEKFRVENEKFPLSSFSSGSSGSYVQCFNI